MQRWAFLAAWLIAGSMLTTSVRSVEMVQSAPDLTKTRTAGELSLERRTHAGAFFDVLGRRAAVFGYEHRGFEAWTYPLKILEDFRLSFSLAGYPLDVPAEELLTTATVRPDSTVFTYSHADRRASDRDAPRRVDDIADPDHRGVPASPAIDVAGRFDDAVRLLE
jgi:hypothetical protein